MKSLFSYFSKNKGAVIASLMVGGMAIFGFGLDWDQTQVAWKIPFSTPFMIVGGAMFVVGFVWLCVGTK